MKKREIKSLTLNKKIVSNFNLEYLKGGSNIKTWDGSCDTSNNCEIK